MYPHDVKTATLVNHRLGIKSADDKPNIPEMAAIASMSQEESLDYYKQIMRESGFTDVVNKLEEQKNTS